jgi:hypothetical protein
MFSGTEFTFEVERKRMTCALTRGTVLLLSIRYREARRATEDDGAVACGPTTISPTTYGGPATLTGFPR